MQFEDNISWLERKTASVIRILQVTSGAVLLLMMLLTAADVVFRYLFNNPIPGSLELVEFMMAILVPFSLACCAFRKSHVAVEFLVGRFSERVQARFETAANLLSLPFIAIITWQSVLYAVETRECCLTSSVLLLDAYPFVAAVAVGMGAFVLVLITHLISAHKEVNDS